MDGQVPALAEIRVCGGWIRKRYSTEEFCARVLCLLACCLAGSRPSTVPVLIRFALPKAHNLCRSGLVTAQDRKFGQIRLPRRQRRDRLASRASTPKSRSIEPSGWLSLSGGVTTTAEQKRLEKEERESGRGQAAKIKRASRLYESMDARAALPQNCSPTKLRHPSVSWE